MAPPTVLLEQVVYGSFAFSDQGYAVLARSARARPEWVDAVVAACRRIGEAPAGVTLVPFLFSLPLPDGPRAVVGVFPQGRDDRGRPGALAFHALLVADRDFRRAGCDPWAFRPALRGEWTAADGSGPLPPLLWQPVRTGVDPSSADHPEAAKIAETLAAGRSHVVDADAPIEPLARAVWGHLPDKARRKLSVATWAFGNDNGFRLVALPRREGAVPAGPTEPAPDPDPIAKPRPWRPRRLRVALGAGGVVALGMFAILYASRHQPTATSDPTPSSDRIESAELNPADHARALAGLERLAERFDIPGAGGPAEVIRRFVATVRYRGPVLTDAERTRLGRETSDPDAARALAWDGQISRFQVGSDLPADLDRLGLDAQMRALAAAYGLRIEAGRSAADVPADLLAALTRDRPVVPTPLAARYPALSDYARFLGRLPRR